MTLSYLLPYIAYACGFYTAVQCGRDGWRRG